MSVSFEITQNVNIAKYLATDCWHFVVIHSLLWLAWLICLLCYINVQNKRYIILSKRFFFSFDFNLETIKLTVLFYILVMMWQSTFWMFFFSSRASFPSTHILLRYWSFPWETEIKYGKKHFKWSKRMEQQKKYLWMKASMHAEKKQHERIVDGFYWWRMKK